MALAAERGRRKAPSCLLPHLGLLARLRANSAYAHEKRSNEFTHVRTIITDLSQTAKQLGLEALILSCKRSYSIPAAAMDEDLFAFNAPTFHDFDDEANGNDDSMEMDPDEAVVGKFFDFVCARC